MDFTNTPGQPFYWDYTSPDATGEFILRIFPTEDATIGTITDVTIELNSPPPPGVVEPEVYILGTGGYSLAARLEEQITNIPGLAGLLDPGDPNAQTNAPIEIYAFGVDGEEFYENLGLSVVFEVEPDPAIRPAPPELYGSVFDGGPFSFVVDEAPDTGVSAGTDFFEAWRANLRFSNYDVAVEADNQVRITNLVDKTEFVATDFDSLAFPDSNTTIDLNAFRGLSDLTADQVTLFTELYVAFFNAFPTSPSDFLGLLAEVAGAEDVDDVATAIFERVDVGTIYDGSLSNLAPEDVEAFVTSVYRVFLLREPDAEGLTHWSNDLVDRLNGEGDRGIELFLVDFISGTRTNPDSAPDRDVIQSKVDGIKLSAHFGLPREAMDFRLDDVPNLSPEDFVFGISSAMDDAKDVDGDPFLTVRPENYEAIYPAQLADDLVLATEGLDPASFVRDAFGDEMG